MCVPGVNPVQHLTHPLRPSRAQPPRLLSWLGTMLFDLAYHALPMWAARVCLGFSGPSVRPLSLPPSRRVQLAAFCPSLDAARAARLPPGGLALTPRAAKHRQAPRSHVEGLAGHTPAVDPEVDAGPAAPFGSLASEYAALTRSVFPGPSPWLPPLPRFGAPVWGPGLGLRAGLLGPISTEVS